MTWLKDVPGLRIALAAAGVVTLVWAIYAACLLVATNDFTRPGQYGDSFGVLNALFSGLAFVGVISALILQVHELRRLSETTESERIDLTLQLFQTFRGEHMYSARRKAWTARTKWFTDPDYRKRQIGHLFPTTLAAIQEREAAAEDAEERRAIYDMLEFYSMLAHHPGSDETVRAFGFYYPWWRGFLRSVIDEYNKAYHYLNLTPDEQRQAPKMIWPEHIDRLERRLGLPPYDQTKHPLDRVFLQKTHATPGT